MPEHALPDHASADELRRVADLYRSIVHQLPVLSYLCDADGTTTYVHEQQLDSLLGDGASENGLNIDEAWGQDQFDAALEVVKKQVADRQVRAFTGNNYKEEFANSTEKRSLTEALNGADVFVGLSVAGAVTGEMLKMMAKDPIIFAMANPDPEITPAAARAARPDAI